MPQLPSLGLGCQQTRLLPSQNHHCSVRWTGRRLLRKDLCGIPWDIRVKELPWLLSNLLQSKEMTLWDQAISSQGKQVGRISVNQWTKITQKADTFHWLKSWNSFFSLLLCSSFPIDSAKGIPDDNLPANSAPHAVKQISCQQPAAASAFTPWQKTSIQHAPTNTTNS